MIRSLATALAASLLAAGCGGGTEPVVPAKKASVSGVVKDVNGAAIAGASVHILTRSAVTDASGSYELLDLPVGGTTLFASAANFSSRTLNIVLVEGSNTISLLLPPADLGVWGSRANLLVANSEFALAEVNGKLYALGGYPSTGQASRTVQVYDIAANSWQLGPQLPQPNNHNMAATVNGKLYVIGGQTTNDQDGLTAVNSVYELDPAAGTWVARAPMPTARSGGVAVALDGKIYVAGGRVPRGNDFAVFDPATNSWEVLPNLPSQRNHIAGAAINGRIHIVGGRLGNGLSPFKSDAHEVFDPATKTWTTAAIMPRARSGMNSAVANGCYHVWGGESPSGMTPDHDYYDPRVDQWFSLKNMPLPVHGVVGSAFVDGLIWVSGGGIAPGGGSGSLHNQTYKPSVSCE